MAFNFPGSSYTPFDVDAEGTALDPIAIADNDEDDEVLVEYYSYGKTAAKPYNVDLEEMIEEDRAAAAMEVEVAAEDGEEDEDDEEDEDGDDDEDEEDDEEDEDAEDDDAWMDDVDTGDLVQEEEPLPREEEWLWDPAAFELWMTTLTTDQLRGEWANRVALYNIPGQALGVLCSEILDRVDFTDPVFVEVQTYVDSTVE
jgi:hypothetical protein